MSAKKHTTTVSFSRLFATLLTALFGYLILLSFPLLTLFSMLELPATLTPSQFDVTMAGVYSGLILLGIAISYHTFTIGFGGRFGIPLPRANTHKLYDFLDEHTSKNGLFKQKIDEIQLSDRHELTLIKVPEFGIPLRHRNVLVVGLSFMQILPKMSFEQALTAATSQLTSRRHRLLYWLASLHHVWGQYPAALRKRNKIGDLFLADFFNWYSRVYKRLSLPLVKKARLLGDNHNRHVYNHHDLLEGIQTEMAAEVYMRCYHWPRLHKNLASNNGQLPTGVRVYADIPDAIKNRLGAEALTEVFTCLYRKPGFGSPVSPPLRQRIRNLGHDKMTKLKPRAGEAANYYLEQDYPVYVGLLEKHWLEKHARTTQAAPPRNSQATAGTRHSNKQKATEPLM